MSRQLPVLLLAAGLPGCGDLFGSSEPESEPDRAPAAAEAPPEAPEEAEAPVAPVETTEDPMPAESAADPNDPCPPARRAAEPWRAATQGDLAPGTKAAVFMPGSPVPECGVRIEVDLNGRGTVDLAELELNESTGEARLRLHTDDRVATATSWPDLPDEAPVVSTWLFPKPPGQPVERDRLRDPARLSAPGAVEVCMPPGGPAAVATAPAARRCYCSTWFWFEGIALREATACD